MRIGVDVHLVKSRPTGVGKTILRTLESMARMAPDDEFIVYANAEFPDTLDNLPNCRVVRTPLIAASRLLRVLHEWAVMPRRVRRDHVDVFWAPGYVFAGRLHVPTALGIFDLNALKFPQLVRRETRCYYRRLMPGCARRAARIIVPTDAVAADVKAILGAGPDKVRVVPLGVDGRFAEPVADRRAAARKFGIGGRYILFVGNIEPNKNLARLVEAFHAVVTTLSLPHQLVIAGKRRYGADDLDRRIRDLDCGQSVIFPGYVPDEDLPGLYAGADVFVYPSVAEGFGIPPLEAMLAGTPVVTSEDPAVVEVTGDAALHVPANDAAALRSALERILTDPAFAAELVRRGRETARKYRWDDSARRTLDVLREMHA